MRAYPSAAPVATPSNRVSTAAHLGDVVQRGDEVHLGGAGVGEADVDPGVDQRADECLRAVHRQLACCTSKCTNVTPPVAKFAMSLPAARPSGEAIDSPIACSESKSSSATR